MNGMLKTCVFALVAITMSGGSFVDGATIKVPGDHDSLPAAVQSAEAGDTIVIEPGRYVIDSRMDIDKPITIMSRYPQSKEYADVEATVIKGSKEAGRQWFNITKSAAGTRIVGLTLEGNNAHTMAIRNENTEVSHCRFLKGVDQLSFEGGGGLISHCYFTGARDDAIDADYSVSWVIENCVIEKTKDDGIEIRLHNKDEPLTTHIVRNNTFVDCRRTGVQLIDYKGDSFRKFKIYGNTFRNIGSTAVDCTLNTANQNVDGSPMVEQAVVFNNTFINCRNGVTMAPNVLVLNNIFLNMREVGVVSGKFWVIRVPRLLITTFSLAIRQIGRRGSKWVGRCSRLIPRSPILRAVLSELIVQREALERLVIDGMGECLSFRRSWCLARLQTSAR